MNPTIRKYLFALCFVFSTCLLGVSVFLVQALSTGVKAVEQETRFFNALDQANEARSVFYNLRYWLTELSVSLLMQSERNADAAYLRFDKSIKSLPGVDSATISTIRTKTNLMVKIAKRAVESYSKDQRVLGNSSMAQTRVHAALVEAEFHKLVSSLKQQAVLARNQTIQGASRAEYLAYIVVALFSIIGFVFTIYLIRSITTPLSHIQDSIREMTAGNLDTKLPESLLGEIGDMTSALRLLRDAELGRLKVDEANRAKSTFLAVMSHELRTPLNAIIGFSYLLLNGGAAFQTADKVQEYVGDIHNSGEHLLSVIDDVLDTVKVESGTMQISETLVLLEKISK
ncbi:MAG: histidine kinase dimerization/phospho-acceptor domain-containing protein [Alphaproteobacteria bacterium]